jgi:hypothetical protein
MSISYETFVKCDFCSNSGRAVPIKICPECSSHICRNCGIDAASRVVPETEGFLRNLGRTLEMQIGACPRCLDRSVAPRPVVINLPSW